MIYPLADISAWWGDADYEQRGGQLIYMSPDEFLAKCPPLNVDDSSRDNIEDLKSMMQSGKQIDPLVIYRSDKTKTRNSDGRHRAIAAKELGIDQVPVIVFPDALNEQIQRIKDYFKRL